MILEQSPLATLHSYPIKFLCSHVSVKSGLWLLQHCSFFTSLLFFFTCQNTLDCELIFFWNISIQALSSYWSPVHKFNNKLRMILLSQKHETFPGLQLSQLYHLESPITAEGLPVETHISCKRSKSSVAPLLKIHWYASFHSNKTQLVKVNTTFSSAITTNVGALQCCVSSAVLFTPTTVA